MKKRIIVGVIAATAFFITPILGAVVFVSAIFPAATEEVVNTYKTAGEAVGADWQQLLAFDTVRYDNDFEMANPEMTALEFLIVDYEKYEKRKTGGTKNNDGDSDTESGYKWVLAKSGTAACPDDIFDFLASEGVLIDGNEFTAMQVMRELTSLKEPQYVITCYVKYIENIMAEYEFTEEQEDWMAELLLENQLAEMLGDDEPYYGPDFIPPEIGSAGIFAWPVPDLHTVTSPFGRRLHPVEKVWKTHYGTDISGPNAQGSPIITVADGIVTEVNFNGGKAGIYVRIKHEIGGVIWTSRYLHMSGVQVKKGEAVEQGTVIGTVGNTGVGTGPHLHIELTRNGMLLDPLPLIR